MLLPVAPISNFGSVGLYFAKLEPLFQLQQPVRQLMLSMVVFSHCINDRVHLGVRSFLTFLFIIFYCLVFIFFLCLLSNVHPNPAIHRLATTVKRLSYYQA